MIPTEEGRLWVKKTLSAIQDVLVKRYEGVDLEEMGINLTYTISAHLTPITPIPDGPGPYEPSISDRFMSTGYTFTIDLSHDPFEVGRDALHAEPLEELR